MIPVTHRTDNRHTKNTGLVCRNCLYNFIIYNIYYIFKIFIKYRKIYDGIVYIYFITAVIYVYGAYTKIK